MGVGGTGVDVGVAGKGVAVGGAAVAVGGAEVGFGVSTVSPPPPQAANVSANRTPTSRRNKGKGMFFIAKL